MEAKRREVDRREREVLAKMEVMGDHLRDEEIGKKIDR